MRRMLAWTIVLIVSLGFAGGVTPAFADPVSIADPYSFSAADVGFVDGSDAAGRASRVAAMDAYVGDKKPIVRLDMFWNDVQPNRGDAPNWTKLDGYVDAAYQQGVRVLLILDYSAAWATGGHATNWFPSDDAAWADIVRQAVAHFGPKVQAYEVWNEPNITAFGNYGDNSVDVRAGRYWQLAKIAYQEVHAGCPGCVVVAGGSAGGDVNADASQDDNEGRDWLEWAYQHGVGGYFDAVAYHPYPDWGGGHLPSYAQDPCNSTTWHRWWSG